MEPASPHAPLSLARSDENVGVPVPNERERGLRSMIGEEEETATDMATIFPLPSALGGPSSDFYERAARVEEKKFSHRRAVVCSSWLRAGCSVT